MKPIVIEEESIAAAARKAVEAVAEQGLVMKRTVGKWCMMKPGVTNLHEISNVTITVTNPLKRWNSRVNSGMLTETLDYMLGLNPGFTHKSSWRFYRHWLEPRTEKYPYTYGERIYGLKSEINQWNEVVKLLKKDSTTRHAHLTIYRQDDLTREFVPCNVAWHFQVDDRGKLNMTTFCRSQDALKGLFLDFFAYSHFLEQMALATDLPLGTYTAFETNLHIYDKDMDKVKTDFAKPTDPYSCGILPAGAQLLTIEHKNAIRELEEQVFCMRKMPASEEINLPSYWRNCVTFIALETLADLQPDLENLVRRIDNKEILWTIRTRLSAKESGLSWNRA